MNGTGKWARRAVWATLVAVMTIGCSPLTSIAFLLHKDERMPAEYPLKPKENKDGPKKDEVTVAVLVSPQPGAATVEFAGAERELASLMAKMMPEMAKAGKQKVAVVPPSKVDTFKIHNPNWRAMRASEIGKKLGADFVLDITLGAINVYQPGSARHLYEGRVAVSVEVYDTTDPTAEPQHYVHPFAYPKTGFKDATEVPLSRFRMLFLQNLAQDLCLKHVDHPPSTGIASGE
jgi:hypothetical protein